MTLFSKVESLSLGEVEELAQVTHSTASYWALNYPTWCLSPSAFYLLERNEVCAAPRGIVKASEQHVVILRPSFVLSLSRRQLTSLKMPISP